MHHTIVIPSSFSLIGRLLTASLTLVAACDPASPSEPIPLQMRSQSAPPFPIATALFPADGETWMVTADGKVQGWGHRYCCDSGCYRADHVPPIEITGFVVQAQGNGDHVAALRDDGTVVTWGVGPHALTPTPFPFDGTVVELAMGSDFLCARLDGGELQCEGLGGPAAPNWLNDFDDVEGAVSVVAGWSHACALLESAEVTCQGDAPTPTAAGLPGAVHQLAAGGGHTCARLESGAIHCWGHDDEGQLGHSTLSVPVALPEPARDVVAGAEHSCAIGQQTEQLYCWGHDGVGVPGIDHEVAPGIWRLDLGGHKASAIFAGATAWTTFVILDHGGLRGWGACDMAQTGYGERCVVDTMASPGQLPDLPIATLPDDA